MYGLLALLVRKYVSLKLIIFLNFIGYSTDEGFSKIGRNSALLSILTSSNLNFSSNFKFLLLSRNERRPRKRRDLGTERR